MRRLQVNDHLMQCILIRAAARNNCSKIALDSGSAPRRGKGRIAALCNPCRNAEDGPEDKQDGMIISCRGPKDICCNFGPACDRLMIVR
jgi:hypothetical protein